MERAYLDQEPTPQQSEPSPGRLARTVSWATSGLDRVVVHSLRTFLNVSLPRFAPDELAAEIDRLSIYTDAETLANPDRLMAAPDRPLRFNLAKRRRIRGGTYSHLRGESPFEPVHHEYRDEYAGYDRLSTMHLYAWQHAEPAPGSIVLIHGWGAGQRIVHQAEFGVQTLFRDYGLDVYFYVLPFHGRRRPSQALFSGELHPSPDLIRTNETFIQTVRELRGIFTTILEHNPAPLGVMGSSLGGYTSALLASIDPRVSFAIPVLPPACLADLFWQQASKRLRAKLSRMGLTNELFREAWALHSPLSYRPLIPASRRLVVSAVGDHLVPEHHVQQLWEHWGRPQHIKFAGSHLLQVGARSYHKQVGEFVRGLGIIGGTKR